MRSLRKLSSVWEERNGVDPSEMNFGLPPEEEDAWETGKKTTMMNRKRTDDETEDSKETEEVQTEKPTEKKRKNNCKNSYIYIYI